MGLVLPIDTSPRVGFAGGMDNTEHLTRNGYGAILADPPWDHGADSNRSPSNHYNVMRLDDIAAMPVQNFAATDCLLFLWVCWPLLIDGLVVMESWGFQYLTCAFDWTKANANQIEMFKDDHDVQVGLGGWTRSNSEVCLLGKRGHPQRLNADVRMAIVEPRREHSRKPDCVYERIERLVGGPYLELFARTRRDGWDSWGNEVGKFKPLSPATIVPAPSDAPPVLQPLPGQLRLL